MVVRPYFQYKCAHCDRVHDGFPAISFDAPAYYLTVPENERAKRCFKTNDLCVVDDQYFYVRCVMEYRILDSEDTMNWGVWGSLSRQNFDIYQEHFGEPSQADIGPFFSFFSNSLIGNGYPETIGLQCQMHFVAEGRPCLHLEPTDHPLSVEQHHGIEFAKALGIASPFIRWHNG